MHSKKALKKAPVSTDTEFLTEGSVFQRKDTGRFCTIIGVANRFTKNPKIKPAQVIFFDPMGRLWSESVEDFLDRRGFYNVDPSAESRILELLSQSKAETDSEKSALAEFEELLAEATDSPVSKQEKPKNLFGFDDADESLESSEMPAPGTESKTAEEDDGELLVIDDEEDRDLKVFAEDSGESPSEVVTDEQLDASHEVIMRKVDLSGFDFQFENTDALPQPNIQSRDISEALIRYEQDTTSFEDAMYALHKFTFAVKDELTRDAIRECFTVEEKPAHRIVEVITNDQLGLHIDWDASVEASKGWQRGLGETLTIVLGVKDAPVSVERATVLEVTPDVPAQQ